MERITSRRNPLVLDTVALQHKKIRKEQGRILVEGPKIIESSLQAGRVPEVVFLRESTAQDDLLATLENSPRTRLFLVTDEVMARISTTRSPCPALGVVSWQPAGLETFQPEKEGIYLMAHRASDPGNVGTLIRLAAASGARGLILSGDACEPTNPKVVRSSMGAIFLMPVYVASDAGRCLEAFRKAGIRVVAADPHSQTTYTSLDLSRSVAFLLGEESSGLDQEILDRVDRAVSIPLERGIDSLNLAMAASILLFESRRQRFSPPA
jgi:RNA methyltransferase, TrmH family